MSPIIILLFISCLLSSVFGAVGGRRRDDGTEFFDLSYSLNEETIFYPGQREFQLFKDYLGWDTKYDRWYAAFSFCMGEHGGTHLDAPYHFNKDGWAVEQIPPDNLIEVPGVVMDIEEKVKNAVHPGEYLLTLQDIIDHETKFGPISPRGILFVYTGWSRFWTDKEKYLGWGDNTTDINRKMHFPGVSEAAGKWLFNERQIVGLGIDTASVDKGTALGAPVHIFLAAGQVYNLENVANLHTVLGKKCIFYILPLKIVGGTGSPTRILAKCQG